VLLNGVALDENSLNGDEFEETVLTELMRQTSSLQKALFRGRNENIHQLLNRFALKISLF
jgi:hypothetical protein